MQLICNKISIGYGNKEVVKDLSFEVNKRDYILVIGENGAGKSTLIKTLLGLVPTLQGSIEWGINKNQVGYLPQQTDIQNDFPATVNEVVISGCLNNMGLRPFYKKAEKEKAQKYMELLRVDDLKGKSFSHLSGGQKQRVLLARALCATNEILILDEPVSGLDPETTRELYEFIHEINKETTVIMISHDVNVSMEYASHVLKLGTKPFFGTKDEYQCECNCSRESSDIHVSESKEELKTQMRNAEVSREEAGGINHV